MSTSLPTPPRPPTRGGAVYVALMSLTSAALALGFELGSPEASEAVVTTQVLTIVGALYAIGERWFRALSRKSRRASELAMVLLALSAVGLGAVTAPGCAGSHYAAQQRADVDWWPGPPCRIEVRLDGEPQPTVTIEAPTACEPEPVQTPAPEVP